MYVCKCYKILIDELITLEDIFKYDRSFVWMIYFLKFYMRSHMLHLSRISNMRILILKYYFTSFPPTKLCLDWSWAFLWEENLNLKFTKLKMPNRNKTDIPITDVKKFRTFRYNCQGTEKYPYKFDGAGQE